jgi:hypothetical protein
LAQQISGFTSSGSGSPVNFLDDPAQLLFPKELILLIISKIISTPVLLREDIWSKSSSSAFANGTIASFIVVTYFLPVKNRQTMRQPWKKQLTGDNPIKNRQTRRQPWKKTRNYPKTNGEQM